MRRTGLRAIDARKQGTYVLLAAALPGRREAPVGVVLVDPESGRGWVRLRRQFADLADADDAEVLEALEPQIRESLAESGAEAWLASMEDSLSNVLRIGERHSVDVDAFTRVLEKLFDEHVEKVAVEPFRTHVPLFSLRAAAGGLGEEMESAAEDWIPAPEGMRLSSELFAAHVVGRSMEPRIPDGSLNLFRLHPAGSRQGRILLVQRFGVLDETARYTVKRYTSTKSYGEGGEWRHERIRLEPLNPEFEPWELGPEDFAVVAEWIRVLE